MTRSDIAQRRLHNQHIAEGMAGEPSDVVAWLCAVQAQDYAGAKWALALRLRGVKDDDVDRAFTAGSILRTHLMRPTWHFVTPGDIRWLLTLTAPRVHAVNALMYRKLELDSAVFEHCNAAVTQALQGGKQLTRAELRDVLQQAGIAADDGQRLAYLMMHAELDGLICSGARRGKQFTYALLGERAPHAKTLERDEALSELTRRYFVSRGPATVHDFAKWSGLTTADARRGLQVVKAHLQHEEIDGQTYWFLTSTPYEGDVSSTAYLLSIYDEYFSSYKDRSAIGEAGVIARLMAMGNALSYIIVVNGQIVGTWKRTLGKDAVIIETHLLAPLTQAEKQAVAVAAQRYGAFLELPVVLV